MSLGEATALIRSRIKADELSDPIDVEDIIKELNRLLLAITQAAAFINEYAVSAKEYLSILAGQEEDVHELLEQDLGDRWRDEESESSVIKT